MKEQIEDLLEILKTHKDAFLQINGTADWRDGWKLSIQGKTLEDTRYLCENVIPFLLVSKASFKFATQLLINMKSEQSTKLLTIYIPNGVEVRSFAELVRLNMPDYTGAKDIPEKRSYTKYSEGIFYRNDRTPAGEYIPA